VRFNLSNFTVSEIHKMDVYDKAMKYLKDNPSKISEIWDDPKSHFSGVLFQAVTPDGTAQENEYGELCGDICEIQSLEASAWTRKLEQEILGDFRIPKLFASHGWKPKITVDMLPIFAEWQRKIDVALSRDPSNFKHED
jgi:hypothetical protein